MSDQLVASYLSIDGLRAVLVMLFALAQIVVGSWPQIKKSDHSIAIRSANLDTPLIPFGPFFAIWLPIFALCMAYATWQILPSNLSDPFLRDIGFLAAGIFLANTLWEAYVPKYGLGWPSTFILATSACLGIWCVSLISQELPELSSYEYWLVAVPLLFLAGWLCLAVFANLSSTLVKAKSVLDPRTILGASILILIAGALVSQIGALSASLVFVSSAIWGLVGIITAIFIKDKPKPIAWVAGFAILLILYRTL